MKVIFSRKGFDSSSGGAPSPILNGRLVSLPIPTNRRSATTYRDLNLGEIVKNQTKNRIGGDNLCHADPLFHEDRCAFGQTGGSQSHLDKNNVSIGDIFLFFGLFQRPRGQKEHWIYGYMQVDEVQRLGSAPLQGQSPAWAPFQHPHTIGEWNENNTLYVGKGSKASTANEALRLTVDGESASVWRVPSWLKSRGLTYHAQRERWIDGDKLRVVGRGQEFISDFDELPEAKLWIESIKKAILA